MTFPPLPVRRIALIGEALVDVFPDADVIGGAPFNVARNLALLGGVPLMLTRVGADARGEAVAAEFERHRMDPRGLQRDAARPTGIVHVHMEGTAHRFEIAADQAWDHLDATQAVADLRSGDPAIVYFGTLAQRSPASRQAIAAALDASPALRFLDLNLREGPDNRSLSERSLRQADVVKVNDEELAQLLAWFGETPTEGLAWGGAAHRAAVLSLARHFSLQRLVITRGARGWGCLDVAGDRWSEGEAPATEVRDTVGAGDAFASVLLLGEVLGWLPSTTLHRAAAFASAVCGIQGAVDASSPLYAAFRARWGA